ncbi:hypothetical protein [Helcococcus kunzii]|uniref:hypothetical protein n=1 Tax=Helcococcus kunzii TaxID=40091 RepID=UPI0021A27782|nr:hypothetical protein [Helcococcus kunzii]MCT1796395.1 hypothetical protein [Helcococcus kunzii]MCT1989445.1 hypothetical protein [Helcococcus kunzii]
MKKHRNFIYPIILIAFIILVIMWFNKNRIKPGNEIFSNDFEFQNINVITSNDLSKENIKPDTFDITAEQNKELLKIVQNMKFKIYGNKHFEKWNKMYTMSAKSKDKQYLVSISDKNILELHESMPGDNSTFYEIKEGNKEFYDILDKISMK